MKKISSWQSIVPLLVFFCGSLISYFVWQQTVTGSQQNGQDALIREQEIIVDAINSRIDIYINTLVAGRAFVDSSSFVSREEWKTFTESLQLQQKFPGIQGYGYSLVIRPEDIQQHVQSVQDEGFEDYLIKPEGVRDLYTSIVYLEPFDERNRQAFGYDMYSNETRRIAMQGAANINQPFATNKVTLVQEIDADVQAGFLIYVPVRESNNTSDSELGNVVGYVYSPFRMDDFMRGIINPALFESNFVIYDDEQLSQDSVMYTSAAFKISDTEQAPSVDVADISRSLKIDIANNTWYAQFVVPEDSNLYDLLHNRYYELLFSGILLSLLLSFTVYLLVQGRVRAVSIAEKMTKELRDNLVQLEQAEHEAAQISKRLTLAANAAGIGFWEWNTKKDECSWNSHMYDIYEINEDSFALNRSSWFNFIDEDDKRLLTRHFKKLSEGEITNLEYTVKITSEHGHKKVIRFYATNKVFENNSVIVGINMDMTREYELDVAKTEFISLASHQLRTPLTSMGWNLETITGITDTVKNTKLQTLTERCTRAHARMVDLVTSLLHVSRFELGTYTVKLEPIALRVFFESITEDVLAIAQKKGVILKMDIPDETIVVDKEILKLSLDNVISNAIKYTPEGGTVKIDVFVGKKTIVVHVVDTGYGIPKDEQEKVFTKLYRATNVSNTETVGTGLGLYIARKALRIVRGTITFVSAENMGTDFAVTIPLE